MQWFAGFHSCAGVRTLEIVIGAGEMRAIGEFNGEHETVKIDRIRSLAASRSIPLAWNEMMFACHFFDHDLYGRRVMSFSSR